MAQVSTLVSYVGLAWENLVYVGLVVAQARWRLTKVHGDSWADLRLAGGHTLAELLSIQETVAYTIAAAATRCWAQPNQTTPQ